MCAKVSTDRHVSQAVTLSLLLSLHNLNQGNTSLPSCAFHPASEVISAPDWRSLWSCGTETRSGKGNYAQSNWFVSGLFLLLWVSGLRVNMPNTCVDPN